MTTIISADLWDRTPVDYRTGNPTDGTAHVLRLYTDIGTTLTPVELRPGPLFPLGRTLTTPGVIALLQDLGSESIATIAQLLWRHQHGDWGILCSEDAEENDRSIDAGFRILSAYTVNNERLWVITEANRSATTVLLPREY